MNMSKTPAYIENVVTLPSTNINGHQILFEPIRGEDVAAISNLYIHNYIPDQTLFRALGVGERLRQALATPDAQESQAFMRETHKYIMGVLIGPSIASIPMVSFKAVCETTGELIGVSLAKVKAVADTPWLKAKYLFLLNCSVKLILKLCHLTKSSHFSKYYCTPYVRVFLCSCIVNSPRVHSIRRCIDCQRSSILHSTSVHASLVKKVTPPRWTAPLQSNRRSCMRRPIRSRASGVGRA